jgi:hypothetical protein
MRCRDQVQQELDGGLIFRGCPTGSATVESPEGLCLPCNGTIDDALVVNVSLLSANRRNRWSCRWHENRSDERPIFQGGMAQNLFREHKNTFWFCYHRLIPGTGGGYWRYWFGALLPHVHMRHGLDPSKFLQALEHVICWELLPAHCTCGCELFTSGYSGMMKRQP